MPHAPTARHPLHARWLEIVHRTPDTPALHELVSGRTWTFAQLDHAASQPAPQAHNTSAAFPSGRNAAFVLDVLRAWKSGQCLCPLEEGQPVPTLAPLPPHIAHLKLTSGSTGTPRLVALTAAQLAADADQIVDTMGLSPDSPNLAVLSLAHSYGFSNLVTPLLLHGIPLVLLPSALPAAVADAARRFPNATLPAVPALWRTWLDAGAIPANLHLALSAGAPLPLAVEQAAFERHGLKIHNFLGASECGGIAFDRTPTPRSDPASAGTAMTGVSLDTDASGCLVVHSPAVAESYLPTPDPRLANGRYVSSDLVDFGPDGTVRIRGRAADLINVAGRKLAPETVELALLDHPAVADCVAVAVPEPGGRGECVGIAYLLRNPAPAVTEDELRAHLLQRLAPWQVPRRWWHRQDLGVDSRGKRSRAQWRQRLLGEAASPM